MRKINSAFLFCLFLVGATYLSAQTPGNPTGNPSNPLPQWVLDRARGQESIRGGTVVDPNRNVTVGAPGRRPPVLPTSPPEPLTEEEMAEAKMASEEYQAKFGISRDYRKQFESFLNFADTGIVRLFPNKDCGGKAQKVVTLSELERCADVPPLNDGGSIWSFRCDKAHRWDCVKKQNVDLKYKDGMFFVGNGIVQGIIADIGDADPAKILNTDDAVKFLSDYDPKQSPEKIAGQDLKLASGIKGYGGYIFTNAVPVKLNSTYVLRSVLYRYHEPGQLWVPRRGIDVTVAFRVVAQEPDGSIIVVWRELDRQYPRRKISD